MISYDEINKCHKGKMPFDHDFKCNVFKIKNYSKEDIGDFFFYYNKRKLKTKNTKKSKKRVKAN